jgi:hypothetical protein
MSRRDANTTKQAVAVWLVYEVSSIYSDISNKLILIREITLPDDKVNGCPNNRTNLLMTPTLVWRYQHLRSAGDDLRKEKRLGIN